MSEPIPLKSADASVERRQLADDAKWLLENKALQAAILALRKRWFAEMMESLDEAQDRLLKAQIRALEAIPQELQVLVNNETMHRARHR